MSNYNKDSIKSMKFPESIRARPGMYIGDTGKQGMHHLLFEVVSNSVDEVMNGHATKIHVIITGKEAYIFDDGRGIPTGTKEGNDKSALEVVLTEIHSGGKFDSVSYATSGGLHGVGIKAVNALSSMLQVASHSHEGSKVVTYSKGELNSIENITVGGKGTEFTFVPDSDIFKGIAWDENLILSRLESIVDLLPVKIMLNGQNVLGKGGVEGIVNSMCEEKDVLASAISWKGLSTGTVKFDCGFLLSNSRENTTRSYVNCIHTKQGGSHTSAFENAIVKAIRDHGKHYLKWKEKPGKWHCLSGVKACISVFCSEPEFRNQTKDALSDAAVYDAVHDHMSVTIANMFKANKETAELICKKVEAAVREIGRAHV